MLLSPKKLKHRKRMKLLRSIRGRARRGCELHHGDYGLRVLEGCWITNRQLEAGRVAIMRGIKRGGKLYINVFPDHPLTSKPAEVRMGKGKGSPERWVADVKAGKIIYELTGVSESLAVEALRKAASRMPVKTEIVVRSRGLL